MLDAWHSCGGLAAQLNRLSIVLHLAVVECVTFALTYDQELRKFPPKGKRVSATLRPIDIDYSQKRMTTSNGPFRPNGERRNPNRNLPKNLRRIPRIREMQLRKVKKARKGRAVKEIPGALT